MGPKTVWKLLRRLALACLLLLAAPAASAASGPCHAAASLAESDAAVAASPQRWTCGNANWSLAAERTYLRFSVAPGQPPPTTFATRLTRFEAMRLTVAAADGRSVSREVRVSDMQPASEGLIMRIPLPRLDASLSEVVVRIDGARHVSMLSQAHLLERHAADAAPGRRQLVIAALCGLLCAPFLFNFAFYFVLRQRFLVWHSLAVSLMLLQTLITSGLINRFVAFSVSQLALTQTAAFGAAVAAAALFTADLIEPEKLDRLHRRLLAAMVPWIAAFTAFYLLADGPLRGIAPTIYYASYIPVLALFAWVMAVALRRGSRAVRFQIAAWIPLMAVGSVRIASVLGAAAAPLDLDFEQQLAFVLEVLISGLGVVDRFMVLRRQRDQALFEARVLEQAVERDPLTGLINRRGIEQRFADCRSRGFRTMAVLDLDHFKTVNDTHGHGVGDDVLRAVAHALAPDDDTIVVRLGGEEFLLLLRGRDAAARAERRREAISTRVAADVPGLERIVTASMGLVEQTAGLAAGGFAAQFAHCDRLLYEAKRAGRNRTMRERVQTFTERRRRHRRARAAHAA
ncbi:MAG: GGDEF domain-containing protein [Novosphingobium sp.]|nr:GGDEF domain-containing protein [Novosphingobium sp.]